MTTEDFLARGFETALSWAEAIRPDVKSVRTFCPDPYSHLCLSLPTAELTVSCTGLLDLSLSMWYLPARRYSVGGVQPPIYCRPLPYETSNSSRSSTVCNQIVYRLSKDRVVSSA